LEVVPSGRWHPAAGPYDFGINADSHGGTPLVDILHTPLPPGCDRVKALVVSRIDAGALEDRDVVDSLVGLLADHDRTTRKAAGLELCRAQSDETIQYISDAMCSVLTGARPL